MITRWWSKLTGAEQLDSDPRKAAVLEVLEQFQEPLLQSSLLAAEVVEEIALEGDSLKLQLCFPYPCAGRTAELEKQLRDQFSELGFSQVAIDIDMRIASSPAAMEASASLTGVKNIVAISSGKGGVGKSTTTVNLALALQAEGAKVGILDADIYGPSQGMMLGVASGVHPKEVAENLVAPIEAHGIASMSIAYLIDETTPMVWRGPMASGAIQQLATQTDWGELDYLLIDMPPGTGDIQLTLSQKVPISGAVVVTTPQDIALLDAKKGVEMFRKVDIPVLGVVENMSLHTCSQCGHSEHIFGAGGGERIARDYQTELLGAMPLSMGIREMVDSGRPSVLQEPEGEIALRYREAAQRMAVALHKLQSKGPSGPQITVADD